MLVAERHPGTSRHPKARLVNTRSMEIYRALGIEDRVRRAGEAQGGFVVADTLSDDHQPWIPPAEDDATSDLSPTTAYSCDQQRIETILRQRAEELGATLLFSTAITDITPAADHVTARVDRENGTSSIRARYLVAADGGRSGLRERLGIGWRGEPVPGTAVSALFSADITSALRGRRTDALLSRRAGAFLFARGNPVDRR